jgi:type II secretory pathway component GspD/PulD (secretin)
MVAVLATLAASCTAGRAFRKGELAAGNGDWDTAVVHLTRAVQEDPDKAEYKATLERATYFASRVHYTKGRELEDKDDLQGALAEYRRAIEYDGQNRPAMAKAAETEAKIRERAETQRPPSKIEKMREEARRKTAEPTLNPASRDPLQVRFTNASLRDILNFIGGASGINVSYDQQFVDKPFTVDLSGVTFEQALNQILRANTLFYKVLDERTIIVVPDSPQKRAQYEEQVIRVFYVSHADVTELAQTINTVIRVPQMAVQPTVMANKTANTITIRATTAVADVIERIIRANDKPRAEVIVDLQILEINRSRAKQYGLALSNYSLGLIFSPEVAPPNVSGAVGTPPPFNLNTISQGVSTTDFYLAVPSAVVKFLESDSRTKIIAKPQLRGAEGTKLSLNLGTDYPVLSSVFGSAAAGGIQTVPVSSYNYRPVGIIVEMTPRVTYDGEIIMDLTVESSTLGVNINVGGQQAPSFGSRKVTTRLRLREGESNLLAGLLREEERKSLKGFPGLLRLPVLRQLFSDNDDSVEQTDIVMLLTPHIVRTHELTQEDLNPIFIGTQQNIGLTGPPPLIAPTGERAAEAAPGTPPAAATPPTQPPAAPPAGEPAPKPGLPPGAPVSPVPGLTPPAQPPAQPPAAQPPAQPPVQPPPEVAAPPAVAPPAEEARLPQAPAPPAAQVLVTPPGTEFRVGSGPYTVPVSINGASRVSVLTLTITYNPAILRVRVVQEGTFMRQGGVTATFTESVDATAGRIDIAITRADDAAGASGAGLLAAVLFDPVAAGQSPLGVSGVGTNPEGAPVRLQFSPVTINVR